MLRHRRRGRQAARRRDDGRLRRPRRGAPRRSSRPASDSKTSRSPGTVPACARECTSARRGGSATTTSASTSTSPPGSPTRPPAASSWSPATRSRSSTATGLGAQEAAVPRQGRAQRRQRLLVEGEAMSETAARDPRRGRRSPRDEARARAPRPPVDLMQIPRLLGGALADIRTIAEGMAMLPKLLDDARRDPGQGRLARRRGEADARRGRGHGRRRRRAARAASSGSSPTSRT